jgi:peptidoglycan/LPS O-acetylase OafA/YrhL
MIGPDYDDEIVRRQDMKGSHKTTLAGIGAILVAGGSLLQALFDGNPSTEPDYAALVAAVMAGLGLIFARDNSVTSEQAGAGK